MTMHDDGAARTCLTSDEVLFAFADGEDAQAGLDEHVAGCDQCQQFLAELWIGELGKDLSAPVIRTIRFDEFLRAVLEVGLGIAARMGKAAVEYSVGGDEEAHRPAG